MGGKGSGASPRPEILYEEDSELDYVEPARTSYPEEQGIVKHFEDVHRPPKKL